MNLAIRRKSGPSRRVRPELIPLEGRKLMSADVVTSPGGHSVTALFTTQPPSGIPQPNFADQAFTSPTFYVGGIDMLGAFGADQNRGEGALFYTWTTLSAPAGAPAPTFSNNGTNASKLVSVAVATPGPYTFQVAVEATDGSYMLSRVTVEATVPGPRIVVGAFSSASPTVGALNQLAVVGTDDIFPESALGYTWFSIARPAGASAPTFSSNGTNASKLVSVSYSKPGTYVFDVVVVDPAGQAALSIETVVVAKPTRPRARG